MRDDRVYLDDIMQCLSRIETYTTGGHETFINSSMIQDAVVRNFEIIGEATKRLSQSLRNLYPEVPGEKSQAFVMC